jgi:hypothetical protein
MGSAFTVLMMAGCLVLVVRGWPLVREGLAGRRLEAALRQGGAERLAGVIGAPARLAEARALLAELPSRDLQALGDQLLALVETQRGAALLAEVAAVVEARQEAEARWRRLRRAEGTGAEAPGSDVPRGGGR